MEETISPYTFSGFLENLYSTDHGEIIMTLSVSKCNFKPEKPLDERQAIINRVREKNPDKIPVVIVEKCTTDKKMISLVVEAKSSIRDVFTMAVKKIYNLEDISNTTLPELKDLSRLIHRDPTAEKVMSSIYEDHKDDDGCLYMTMTGVLPKIIADALVARTNQSVLDFVGLYKEYHHLREKMEKRQQAGWFGSILGFVSSFTPWKLRQTAERKLPS